MIRQLKISLLLAVMGGELAVLYWLSRPNTKMDSTAAPTSAYPTNSIHRERMVLLEQPALSLVGAHIVLALLFIRLLLQPTLRSGLRLQLGSHVGNSDMLGAQY